MASGMGECAEEGLAFSHVYTSCVVGPRWGVDAHGWSSWMSDLFAPFLKVVMVALLTVARIVRRWAVRGYKAVKAVPRTATGPGRASRLVERVRDACREYSQREEPRACTTPQEKPLPRQNTRERWVGHRKTARPPATERLAGGRGEHNEGTSETQHTRKGTHQVCRVHLTGMRSGDTHTSAECLPLA